ncbi:acyltransferase [Nocardiopsis sp. N85]|uniref:acyltransferase family protein n=1 Tax=Nocardiopsis sp. N85 TaxID=3029400 RepID=UPI00237EEC53|nr:acyltransferase [Nocardiopsis sp. N85]MDE3725067.1 acyltransferase [Nocardiopsis sp. N85]
MWTANNPNGKRDVVEGTGRLHHLDALKLFLIVLVVVLHAAQPYGPADWWYVEREGGSALLAEIARVGGTFLMSLFLFVSAFFVPAAHDRQGGARFLGHRFRRFLPLVLIGFFVVVPALMYPYHQNFRDHPSLDPLTYYLDVYLGEGETPQGWTGPSWPDRQFAHLWFLQHLLVYVSLYAAWRWVAGRFGRPRAPKAVPSAPPGTIAICGFVVVVSVSTFLLRVPYPVDTWIPLLEFIQTEPADLALQASFFWVGLLAYRHGWLTSFGERAGLAWLAVGGVLAAAHLSFGSRIEVLYAPGGLTTGSLLWSTVETVMCVSLSIGLLTAFRRWANRPSPRVAEAGALVFTVYLIHVPVVVALQYATLDLAPWPAFVIVAVVGTVASLLLARLLSRTPVLRRVL